MDLEPGGVPEHLAGSFESYLREGDPMQWRREGKLRRRALLLSTARQVCLVCFR
jgi:hypothetical protein